MSKKVKVIRKTKQGSMTVVTLSDGTKVLDFGNGDVVVLKERK